MERPLLVLGGLSGAGKATAAKMLEDAGWRILDALPGGLIEDSVRRMVETDRLAVVIDIRSGDPAAALDGARRGAGPRGVRILLLDAADETLVRRYAETRRPHPVEPKLPLIASIAMERARLAPLFSDPGAEVLATDGLSPTELAREIGARLEGTSAGPVPVHVVSFSYRKGLPADADLVFDARPLPNPHWVPDLRERDGRDAEVAHYALDSSGHARSYARTIVSSVAQLVEALRESDRARVTVAIGCTGGRHRSVALAERVAETLRNKGVDPVSVEHRHLEA